MPLLKLRQMWGADAPSAIPPTLAGHTSNSITELLGAGCSANIAEPQKQLQAVPPASTTVQPPDRRGQYLSQTLMLQPSNLPRNRVSHFALNPQPADHTAGPAADAHCTVNTQRYITHSEFKLSNDEEERRPQHALPDNSYRTGADAPAVLIKYALDSNTQSIMIATVASPCGTASG